MIHRTVGFHCWASCWSICFLTRVGQMVLIATTSPLLSGLHPDCLIGAQLRLKGPTPSKKTNFSNHSKAWKVWNYSRLLFLGWNYSVKMTLSTSCTGIPAVSVRPPAASITLSKWVLTKMSLLQWLKCPVSPHRGRCTSSDARFTFNIISWHDWNVHSDSRWDINRITQL